MGLYNYLGNNQVKCFTIPNMIINSNGNLEIYGLEGKFIEYKRGSKVPYKTLYYNYGENFLIFDYRGVIYDEIPLIHIIKNGKYSKTVEYQKLNEEDFINKVIDKFGNSINIKEYSDISTFIEDYKLRDKNSITLTKKYNEELGVKCYSISDLREKKVSSEQLIKDLDKRKIEAPAYLSVEADQNAEIIWFKVDRFYDNIDLYSGVAWIQYINADKEERLYAAPLLVGTEQFGNEQILIPWEIGKEDAKTAGTIQFSFQFFQLSEDS